VVSYGVTPHTYSVIGPSGSAFLAAERVSLSNNRVSLQSRRC
jgi:hypothetical protein